MTTDLIAALEGVRQHLAGQAWTPSRELAITLSHAAEVALAQDASVENGVSVRKTQLVFEELFKQHRAERVESNLLALGRLHTEHELGRRLRTLVHEGRLYRGKRKSSEVTSLDGADRVALADLGFDYPNGKHDSADFQRLADLEVVDLDEQAHLVIEEQEISTAWAVALWRQMFGPSPAAPGDPPAGRFRCIVIDPPWPMPKIERDVRPNQGPVLDYPTMTIGEKGEIETEVGKLVHDKAAEDGCHVYLWTTHKFLPEALRLFTAWHVAYECSLTWVKPTGITPFSWQYNTEHVLFGRIGSLGLDIQGLKLSIEAPVTFHSEKPDAFYERVALASPGPRLELFARRVRPGFEPWGNQVERIAEVV